MKKATYREIPALLEQRKAFTGNSVAASSITLSDGSKSYTVWSYDTVIYKEVKGDCIYFNGDYYSRTTSKLQNILRQVFSNEIADYKQRKAQVNNK